MSRQQAKSILIKFQLDRRPDGILSAPKNFDEREGNCERDSSLGSAAPFNPLVSHHGLGEKQLVNQPVIIVTEMMIVLVMMAGSLSITFRRRSARFAMRPHPPAGRMAAANRQDQNADSRAYILFGRYSDASSLTTGSGNLIFHFLNHFTTP
ncbi:hypothetical protein HUU39_03675 [candidate division KSB1 bacterium]|nr:hypothetical protein [bacterium]NUM64363.1 hypothetical protein [candidate division KSB1 bacterium]